MAHVLDVGRVVRQDCNVTNGGNGMMRTYYRKAWEVVGWTYDADVHCLDCAGERFGVALRDESNPPTDSEGNDVHPVFLSDIDGLTLLQCADCETFID